MKKIDVLAWAVEHIATNHGFSFVNEDDGEHTFTIFGNNVPTLSDVRMMCEDLGLTPDEDVYSNDYGIDIFFGLWNDEQGNDEYIPGMESWKRFGVEIGS